MLEFCPLCQKNGYKRKITLRQINLQEAVWLCEHSECPWPFGYQDFIFVPRKVGATWSAEWESYKPKELKSSESFSTSVNELGLDTPPVTPGSGSEVTHKDTVFGDGVCSVTSLNSNANNVIQAKANPGTLKNSGSKPRHSFTSECGSIDTESLGTRDFKGRVSLNDTNRSLRDKETLSEFHLGNDINSESLDKCPSVSQGVIDIAEASAQSVFNVGIPSRDNLSIHESTVKCKKWLSDNTEGMGAEEHCYSFSGTKRVNVESENGLSDGLHPKLQRSSIENVNGIKRRPKIKSIEKTNVKLAGVIDVSNQSIEERNEASSATVAKTSLAMVGDLSRIVEDKREKDITSTHASHCITVSENRTLTIDGLLPIHISYEVPSFVEECTTIPQNTDCIDNVKEEILGLVSRKEPVLDNSVIPIDVIDVKATVCAGGKTSQFARSSKTETQRQSMKKPLKRTIPKLAKYQGFNFGTLKKKSKTTADENTRFSLPNIPSPDNVSSCSDLTWTSEISCATATTTDSKSESVSSGNHSNSKSTLSVGDCSPVTSSSDSKSGNVLSPENYGILESNFNLDRVLDDLMLNDNEDLTTNFGDEWLTSLFN